MQLTKDQQMNFHYGEEFVRMIRQLHERTSGQPGYFRRKIEWPNGYVEVFVVNNSDVADYIDEAARVAFDVDQTVRPM